MTRTDLHPDLERLVKRPTTLDRAVLLALILVHAAFSILYMVLVNADQSQSLVVYAAMMLSTLFLVAAIVAVPATKAWRTARFAELFSRLEDARLCPACGDLNESKAPDDRCATCHRSGHEALQNSLEQSIRLVASGLRPQLCRAWARFASDTGHAGIEEIMNDVRLPRRPIRISYFIAMSISIGLIVLVFSLMSVSDAAPRVAAVVAIPIIAVSFLAAFLTASPAAAGIGDPRWSKSERPQG